MQDVQAAIDALKERDDPEAREKLASLGDTLEAMLAELRRLGIRSEGEKQEPAATIPSAQRVILPPRQGDAVPELREQKQDGCTYYCLDLTMWGQPGIGAPDGKTRFNVDPDGYVRNAPNTSGLDQLPQLFQLVEGTPAVFMVQHQQVLPPPGALRFIMADDPEMAGQVVTGPAPYNWKVTFNAEGRGFVPENVGFDGIPGYTLGDYLTPEEHAAVEGYFRPMSRPASPASPGAPAFTPGAAASLEEQARQIQEQMQQALAQEAPRQTGAPQPPPAANPPGIQILDRQTAPPGPVPHDPNATGLPAHLAANNPQFAPVDPNSTGLPAHLAGEQSPQYEQAANRLLQREGQAVEEETEGPVQQSVLDLVGTGTEAPVGPGEDQEGPSAFTLDAQGPAVISDEQAAEMKEAFLQDVLAQHTRAQLESLALGNNLPVQKIDNKATIAERLIEAQVLVPEQTAPAAPAANAATETMDPNDRMAAARQAAQAAAGEE